MEWFRSLLILLSAYLVLYWLGQFQFWTPLAGTFFASALVFHRHGIQVLIVFNFLQVIALTTGFVYFFTWSLTPYVQSSVNTTSHLIKGAERMMNLLKRVT